MTGGGGGGVADAPIAPAPLHTGLRLRSWVLQALKQGGTIPKWKICPFFLDKGGGQKILLVRGREWFLVGREGTSRGCTPRFSTEALLGVLGIWDIWEKN